MTNEAIHEENLYWIAYIENEHQENKLTKNYITL